MPADDEPFCRDCADENGTCPHDGTPCDLAAPTGAAAPTRYVCTRCDWQGEAASLTDAQQRHWEANVECTRAANYSSVEPAASPAARAPARAGATEEWTRDPDRLIAIIRREREGYNSTIAGLRAEVSRLSARTPTEEPESLAQAFHEAYERLAPSFGYATREASAKPWADVPENNRRLMTAVCTEILSRLAARTGGLKG